jgi:hypothetical protein
MMAIYGNEGKDRLADYLLGGIAEHPFGGVVPCLNDAIEILADDRIFRGFNDRSETVRGIGTGMLFGDRQS